MSKNDFTSSTSDPPNLEKSIADTENASCNNTFANEKCSEGVTIDVLEQSKAEIIERSQSIEILTEKRIKMMAGKFKGGK